MVMSEVSLCRIEERLLGIAHELRPTLAIGDSAGFSVGGVHPVRYGPCGGPEWITAGCWWSAAPGDRGRKPFQPSVGDTFP